MFLITATSLTMPTWHPRFLQPHPRKWPQRLVEAGPPALIAFNLCESTMVELPQTTLTSEQLCQSHPTSQHGESSHPPYPAEYVLFPPIHYTLKYMAWLGGPPTDLQNTPQSPQSTRQNCQELPRGGIGTLQRPDPQVSGHWLSPKSCLRVQVCFSSHSPRSRITPQTPLAIFVPWHLITWFTPELFFAQVRVSRYWHSCRGRLLLKEGRLRPRSSVWRTKLRGSAASSGADNGENMRTLRGVCDCESNPQTFVYGRFTNIGCLQGSMYSIHGFLRKNATVCHLLPLVSTHAPRNPGMLDHRG